MFRVYFDLLILVLIYRKPSSNDSQSGDYIVVDEYSEERCRRGRPSLRINIRNDSADAGKRETHSPLVGETQRVTQSADLDGRRRRQERSRSPTRIKITERYSNEPMGSSYRQRVVQEAAAGGKIIEPRQRRGRRTRSLTEEYEDPRRLRATAEDLENWRVLPDQEYTLKEKEIDTTSTTKEPLRRRRHDRTVEDGESNWKGPSQHSDIRPPRDGDVLVVTERYVYRPHHLSHVLEDGQRDCKSDSSQNVAHPSRQGRIDEATIGAGKHYRNFTDEAEAFSYFRDDWHRDELRHEREPRRRVRSRKTADDFVAMFSTPKFDRENPGNLTSSLLI
jgi:hypothetical protein